MTSHMNKIFKFHNYLAMFIASQHSGAVWHRNRLQSLILSKWDFSLRFLRRLLLCHFSGTNVQLIQRSRLLKYSDVDPILEIVSPNSLPAFLSRFCGSNIRGSVPALGVFRFCSQAAWGSTLFFVFALTPDYILALAPRFGFSSPPSCPRQVQRPFPLPRLCPTSCPRPASSFSSLSPRALLAASLVQNPLLDPNLAHNHLLFLVIDNT